MFLFQDQLNNISRWSGSRDQPQRTVPRVGIPTPGVTFHTFRKFNQGTPDEFDWKDAAKQAFGYAFPAAMSYFGHKASVDATEASNAAAERAEDKKWNRETQYNHPSAQMQRLKEAGLNPRLIYSSGSATAAGNTNADIHHRNPYSYQDTIQKYLLLENARKQNEMLDAQIGNVKEDTTYKKSENRLLAGIATRNDPGWFRFIAKLAGLGDNSLKL